MRGSRVKNKLSEPCGKSGSVNACKVYAPTLEELINYQIPFLTAKGSSMYLQYNKNNYLFECFYLNGRYICSFTDYHSKPGYILLENLQTKSPIELKITNLIPLKNA